MKSCFTILIASLLLLSCENDWDDVNPCTCNNGGQIGGWGDEQKDTVQQKPDTIPSQIIITVTEWGDTIVHEIRL